MKVRAGDAWKGDDVEKIVVGMYEGIVKKLEKMLTLL